jgi:hypothetical protein
MYRFDHGSKRLLVFNLRLLQDAPDLAVSECILSPASLVDFDVNHVLCNETGSMVALVGAHGCCVVNLSRRLRSEFNKRPRTVVECKVCPFFFFVFLLLWLADDRRKVSALGHIFFGTHPEVRIVKGRWHPASLSHLALLCSDNVVRLYNVLARDLEDPEQLLRVSLESLRVVSFDFGASLDWTHFTVFYLLSDGNVYAQCPVIPMGCPVPEELLTTLELRQKQEIERLDAKLARLNGLKASGMDVARRIRRTVKRAAGSAKALKWIELVRAGKVGQLMAQSDLPVLQGPLTVSLAAEADAVPEDERVCDLLVAATQFPVLVTVFESGLVELRLQLCSLFPAWPYKSSGLIASGVSASRSEVLVLFDRFDVAPSVLRGCGTLDAALHPSVYADPLHENVWYVRHAGGIECIALPSLDSVLSELAATIAASQNSQTPASSQPMLPRAEVASLLLRDTLSVGNRMLGMCVVASAAGEYFLAYECEAAEGSVLRCLDLLGASGGPETSVPEGAPPAAARKLVLDDDNEELKPPTNHTVAAWMIELRELDKRRPKAVPHVETLSSGRLTRLEQLQEATQLAEAYKRHAAHLAEGNAILKAASDDMNARKAEISKLTQLAQTKLRALTQRGEHLDRIFGAVKSNNANLKDRLTEISSLLTSLQPTLTDAERAYFALLKSKESELTVMEKSVDGLNKFVESHPAIFKPLTESQTIDPDVLDEKRLLVLQENLDKQNETIAKLVVSVRDLQSKVL